MLVVTLSGLGVGLLLGGNTVTAMDALPEPSFSSRTIVAAAPPALPPTYPESPELPRAPVFDDTGAAAPRDQGERPYDVLSTQPVAAAPAQVALPYVEPAIVEAGAPQPVPIEAVDTGAVD